MKKSVLKSIVSLSALVALSLAPLTLAAPSGADLTGVWDSQVTLTDCNGNTLVSFEAYGMFNTGGTFTSTDNTPPGRQSIGFGTWRKTGPRTYAAPFQFFNFNADGTFAGTQKITRTITLAANGASYTSVVNFQSLDPSGNVIFSGCGTEAATRLP